MQIFINKYKNFETFHEYTNNNKNNNNNMPDNRTNHLVSNWGNPRTVSAKATEFTPRH